MNDLYHSKLRAGNAGKRKEDLPHIMAATLIPLYRTHLENCWPEIKNDVEIGFIEGTNFTEIGITQTLGWKNENWVSFFVNGIALPIALEKCKTYGIVKFVIFHDNEILEYSTIELLELTKQ
jgi:hypothetical protein